MPRFVVPQAPVPARKIPTGPEWIHEIKHDGYRIQARIDRTEITLTSRTRRDWTARFVGIVGALRYIANREVIIDGEVAFPDERGVTNVEDMRDAIRRNPTRLVFYVFDLLWCDGVDLRSRPLLERKTRLERLIRPAMKSGRIMFSEHVPGPDGPALYRHATKLGCEGIVSKRADAPYRSGEGDTWRKIKPETVRKRQAESVRAKFAREIDPEAAADLERLGLKDRLFPIQQTETDMPAKRELIAPRGDKRYVRRGEKGQFKEADDVGKSLSSDRRRKAKTVTKRGEGDKGDRRPGR